MSSQAKQYLGWQVGITYEAARPEGNDLPRMLRLLGEMANAGMNLLSLMMASYAYFDPAHDGLAWPVQNSRLECLRDKNCLNAHGETEFVQELIAAAAKKGIEVQLFTNLAIYNPERIRGSYPGALPQTARDLTPRKWLFCPSGEDVWQLENDEISDLLALYGKANVTSIAYERLSFASGTCYCENCARQFRESTGRGIKDFTDGDALFDAWKVSVITDKMSALNRAIKTAHPGTQVWLHSSCAPGWGHDPARLAGAGVDCVVPHIAHSVMEKQDFDTLLDRLAPNDTVLHFCVRNKALPHYPIWEKTPADIAEIGGWALDYARRNERMKGILFFNENTFSNENRQAVYRLVEQFAKSPAG